MTAHRTVARRFTSFRRAALAGAAFACGAIAGASAPARAADFTTPEQERAAMKLDPQVEVTLFAAEPMVEKPVQMNFDSQGRLWVVCAPSYPMAKPGEQANDRVIILEDTDHDGKADKSTVFADKMVIPTGVAPSRGGAYVANSTEILFLKDGPGKAPVVRQQVLAGFGVEDTHHIVHTFRWGPDGALYFNQSIYIHSHLETPHGPRTLNGGGIWRYRTDTQQLEVVARGLVNPWGDAFDQWGQAFATDGAGGEGVNIVIPGATFQASPEPRKILPGLNPGSPKYCGAEIISGRHFPDDWQGSLITNDFRANRMVRFAIAEDGSGYSARLMRDVIKSSDPCFRPVDAKLGPDGALYIADWCNPIIQHGEVDFRDPRRDHLHGRIWRLTIKGRPLVEPAKVAGASIPELLELLKAPEDFTRLHAKQELSERDRDQVAAAVPAFVKSLDIKEAAYPHNLLEALWTLQTIDRPDAALLERCLNSAEPRVRAAATRTLGHWRDRIPDAFALLSARTRDEFARTRLEAVRALARYGTAEAFETATQALDLPTDRFLDYALAVTADELHDAWVPLFEAKKLTFGNSAPRRNFALQSARSTRLIKDLLADYSAGKAPADSARGIAALIATSADPADAEGLFAAAVALSPKSPDLSVAALSALADAANPALRPGNAHTADLRTLIARANAPRVSAAAARLAGAWRLDALTDDLYALARDRTAEAVRRTAAISALGALSSRSAPAALLDFAKTADIPARLAVARALAPGHPREAAALAAEILSADLASNDPLPMLSSILSRRSGPAELSAALAGKTIPPDSAKLALRALYTLGRDFPDLAKALSAAANLTSRSVQLSAGQMTRLIAQVDARGDAARGEDVFRSAQTACMRCHSIGGAGGALAPDLLSIGASAPVDYLIDSLLLPAKAVKEGYNAIEVTDKAGDIFTGIKVKSTDKDLILRDATHDFSIPLSSIRSQRDAGSMMPLGIADAMTDAEFLDLVKFLSSLGKAPFAVGQAQFVRTWQWVDLAPAKLAALAAQGPGAPTPAEIDRADAYPVYAKVSGLLPPSALDITSPAPGQPDAQGANAPADPGKLPRILRCRINVTTPGDIHFTLNSVAGLSLRVDDAAAELPNPAANLPEADRRHFDLKTTPVHLSLRLAKGSHTLTFTLNPAERFPAGLSLQLNDESTKDAQVMQGARN